ncbi:MAG: sodium-translocating pyrophosphatase [Treponemataceae bacterium]|nr:sodium-translocating pyrophosphatase [Treponemataceae bacterium]
MGGLLVLAIIGAFTLAATNFYAVKRKQAGTQIMQEIAGAIQEGADAFIRHEYKMIGPLALIIALILAIIVSWYTGVAFLIGALMSSSAGWVGMKIATLANVRVANTARETRHMGETLKVAFQGGSVMGLSVGGFALLGLGIVYLVFGVFLGQASKEGLVVITNWLGINFIPFTMSVSGYALGCSVIAMFDRVGGGIYTKAADMGADLVGKTEARIPEDDPRNPATIADNVGDNVGDVAGLGADLLESYVGAIISVIVLTGYLYYTNLHTGTPLSFELTRLLIIYPLMFAAIGILSCVLSILYLVLRKPGNHPHRELNRVTWASAFLTVIGTGILTWLIFSNQELKTTGFTVGSLSPWFAAVLGIISGIAIGYCAEYYTSFDYKPTQQISAASEEGPALTITSGMALGMRSVFVPVIILALATIGSTLLAGLYGVAMAAVGMLSFVATTVSVDTYGPIADNAGGISQMAKLDEDVRNITDHLDSVGNTTAAIGKGFAIGSAAFAALSLFASYLYTQAGPESTKGFHLILNMINAMTLAGAMVGAALPYLFSGILIDAVAKAARNMVQEIRRQFKENPKILTGEARPNYRQCIEISSAGALNEMKKPAFISVLTPLVTGFIFGPDFVGGLLIGTTLSAIMLALYTANAGGAWDNGKKYIENGHHGGKGSEAHAAAVIGDTVGDPLKDTVGPSLDILIKIMAVVSLIMVNIFTDFNVMKLIHFFK